MKRYLPITVLVAIITPILFLVIGPRLIASVKSTSSSVVISEIQTSGVSGNDEFIELYNASISDVDLTGYRLTKRPQDGSPETNLIENMSGTIPAHGFFLIAYNKSYASPSADLIYNSALADQATVTVYASGNPEPLDLVGIGTASVYEVQSTATAPSGGSVERKAGDASTAESMTTGADQAAGNGYDTDNNLNDFIIRETAQPQNSQSAIEPAIPLPTPTAEPTPTPEPTPEPTPTELPEPTATPTTEPTPTEIPTPTVTPTLNPTPTPTNEPEPTATPIPEITPTPTDKQVATPTPTAEPEATPTPTIHPTPTPELLGQAIFPNGVFSCYLRRVPVRVRWFTFYFPRVSCGMN